MHSFIYDPPGGMGYTLLSDLSGGYLNEIRGWTFGIPNVTGDRVKIELVNADGTLRSNYLHLAEVEVYNETAPAPVPEPATMLLVGSGLAGLGWFGRKRRDKDRQA